MTLCLKRGPNFKREVNWDQNSFPTGLRDCFLLFLQRTKTENFIISSHSTLYKNGHLLWQVQVPPVTSSLPSLYFGYGVIESQSSIQSGSAGARLLGACRPGASSWHIFIPHGTAASWLCGKTLPGLSRHLWPSSDGYHCNWYWQLRGHPDQWVNLREWLISQCLNWLAPTSLLL